MRYFYDLHIHTALSPCADILMSPNNILNMAMLKELNIIAVTDHNSCLQLDVVKDLIESYEMLVIPGAEVEVNEKYHVVCLFKTFEIAKAFQQILDGKLTNRMHDEIIYGEQQVFDIYDDIVYNYQTSLMGSSNFSLKELNTVVKKFDGLMILAHIEKYPSDIFEKVSNEYYGYFDAIEVNANYDISKIENKLDKRFMILRDSDAHQIVDISEAENFIELENLSIDCFFETIRGSKQ